MPKILNLASFWIPETCGHAALPESSIFRTQIGGKCQNKKRDMRWFCDIRDFQWFFEGKLLSEKCCKITIKLKKTPLKLWLSKKWAKIG